MGASKSTKTKVTQQSANSLPEDMSRETQASGIASGEEHIDASLKSSEIITIINELEHDLDSANELQEDLQNQLIETTAKLKEESDARMELTEQMENLVKENEAVNKDRLCEDLAFIENDRSRLNKDLEETRADLEAITLERDSLVKQVGCARKNIDTLQQEKIRLEEKAWSFEKNKEEASFLRNELKKTRQQCGKMESNIDTLTQNLETSESLNKSINSEINIVQQKLDKFRNKLSLTMSQFSELHDKYSKTRKKNQEMHETNMRLERETKSLTMQSKISTGELSATHKELDKVLLVASRLAKRFRG